MADVAPETGPFAAAPDGFERLWTPHRMAYVSAGAAPATGGGASAGEAADGDRHGPGEPEGCPFCHIPTRADDDALIVHRGRGAYVVLNLFPYNPGHLLVCPYRHVADYTDLTEPEVAEVAALTRHAMRVIRAVSAPAGFNLGMNQGTVAGAGIAAHLHQHVVPRWVGDANFLPIVGQTKALPELLADTRQRLVAGWATTPGLTD